LQDNCSKFVESQLASDDDVDDEDRPKLPRCDVLINVETLTKLEENYARSHQFLASTLNEMTQKRNVPHLNGLAAALAHSCPSVAVEIK
jgi:hypothetical protein